MDRRCSRRDFLKKFAAFSSAPLLFGMSGCGNSDSTPRTMYGPGPVYGPAPVVDPMVYNICYLNGNIQVSLYDNLQVPIDKKFVFAFTREMDTSLPVTVALTQGINDVPLDSPIWESAWQLSVMPSAVLMHDTEYTLRLTDATDASGTKIIINDQASASFKTLPL